MEKALFRIPKMDCPSEEQLIRMRLEGGDAIRSLSFDLQHRTLEVVHAGDTREIASRLESLQLGSTLIASEAIDVETEANTAQRQRRLLLQVLAINFVFFLVEVFAGFAGNSMGLVADSLDMLADSIVYGLSLYAIGRSVGHKAGVATISGWFQLVLAILGLVEVVRRFVTPEETPSFAAMIAVSLFALAANATCLWFLQQSRSEEAHMQASMIFTSNDVIANLGVILAGVLVLVTRSQLPDLVAGIAIFAVVARGAFRILRLARTS